jgi:O-antigen/teichoic acid export membrane protein
MLGGRTFMMATGFLTAALINYSLGPSMRGVYAEMQTWVGLFAVIFGISMDTAIYHFANKSLYGNDVQARLMTVFSLSLVYALFASLALAVFSTLFPGQISVETSRHLFLLNLVLICTMLVGNLTIFLQALGYLRYSAVMGCVQGTSSAILFGMAYWIGVIDVRFVLICLIIVQVIGFLMLLTWFVKEKFLNGSFSKELAKGIMAAGLKQHIATIATFVYMKINQLIVFRYCGESETGLFAVSLTAAFYLMFIPMTLQTVLYPRIINGADDYEITIRSLRFTFYSWGFVVLLMILFAKPIILLYAGKDFLNSVLAFRILMVAAWFFPLSALVAPYCVKLGAFYAMSLSAIALGVISILLNVILIPNLLKIGAAISTSATSVFGFCIVLVLLRFLSHRNPLEFVKIKRIG